MKSNNFSAKVFVSTYAKYNNGRGTVGKWLKVEDYESKEAFLDACKKIHDDESEPEFMFADYEGVPNGYISESYVSEWLFKLNDLDEYFDFDAFRVFCEYMAPCIDDGTPERFESAFFGEYDSEEAFAEQYAYDTCILDQVPESVRYYFDYAAFARDLFIDDFNFCEGYVFCQYY